MLRLAPSHGLSSTNSGFFALLVTGPNTPAPAVSSWSTTLGSTTWWTRAGAAAAVAVVVAAPTVSTMKKRGIKAVE